MKPIPTERRKRILDDGNNGMTEIAAAEKWKVSPSFITKLKRRVRDIGSLEPTKPKTGPTPKLLPHHELFKQIVAKNPDATIEEIREQLPVPVCPQTVANWVNNTSICGLRYNRIVAPHVFVGAMNAVRFLHYLETILLPTLRKDDIVVMDNLPVPLDGRVVPLIASKGVRVLYLPGYGPDLNPIELSFSKLKSVLRKLKIRDVPTLQKFLLESGRPFTKNKCKAYFKYDGYTVHKR